MPAADCPLGRGAHDDHRPGPACPARAARDLHLALGPVRRPASRGRHRRPIDEREDGARRLGHAGVLGGCNWSVQHLDRKGADGQASGVDGGVDGPLTDEVRGGGRRRSRRWPRAADVDQLRSACSSFASGGRSARNAPRCRLTSMAGGRLLAMLRLESLVGGEGQRLASSRCAASAAEPTQVA